MAPPPAPPPDVPRWHLQRKPDTDARPTRAMRMVYFFGPIVVTLALYGLVWFFAPARAVSELTVAATASLFAFGTAVVLGPALLGPDAITQLTTWDLAWIVMYLTAMTAFFFSYNLDLLHRVPFIGPPLRKARADAVQTLKERPWIRRWATIGVGIFVLLPLPGSGSLGGSIVGRMLGLRRFHCFLAVTAAGIVVCLAYAFFGDAAQHFADQHEVPLWVRLLVLVGMGILLFFASRGISRAMRTTPVTAPSPDPPPPATAPSPSPSPAPPAAAPTTTEKK